MEKLQEYLSDWESELYKTIKKALSELASKYEISQDVIDSELMWIYSKLHYYVISGDKEEFAVRRTIADAMVFRDFISPLIEKYSLIKKNERMELEKSLVHREFEVTQIKLGETETKLAQMERIAEQSAERKAKKAWNSIWKSIKYLDIVKAIREIMDIDPTFNIKSKVAPAKRIRNQEYVLTESDIVNRICEHKDYIWDEKQQKVAKKHIQKARKNMNIKK